MRNNEISQYMNDNFRIKVYFHTDMIDWWGNFLAISWISIPLSALLLSLVEFLNSWTLSCLIFIAHVGLDFCPISPIFSTFHSLHSHNKTNPSFIITISILAAANQIQKKKKKKKILAAAIITKSNLIYLFFIDDWIITTHKCIRLKYKKMSNGWITKILTAYYHS